MYFIGNCDAFCHHFNKVLCMYVCMYVGRNLYEEFRLSGARSPLSWEE